MKYKWLDKSDGCWFTTPEKTYAEFMHKAKEVNHGRIPFKKVFPPTVSGFRSHPRVTTSPAEFRIYRYFANGARHHGRFLIVMKDDDEERS